jgi:long-subunit acyl-CoA synthetase (AMP-forming)
LWIVMDLAIQIAGGVTVPIFTKISAESFLHEI